MHILIVEDEAKMAQALKKGLESENHRVTTVHDGRAALEYASVLDIDVIVLDLMLPILDGLEVARRLRRNKSQIPILMLTARDSDIDIVRGLDSGADDYLTKPFAFAVLAARIRSISRRGVVARPACLKIADLMLNPASHRVFRGSKEIHLSATEFRLLEFLMRREDRVVSIDDIVQAVWDLDDDVEDNTVVAFVRLLRSKVDQDYVEKLIHTVRGVGYMIHSGSDI